jgi:sugar phosphate isomerase/epimerase
MKLAISNIAWQPDEDRAVIGLMHEYGVTGIEIAPTKIWQNPLAATDADIRSYAARWKKEGITVSSMQALLYGQPQLRIFESRENRLLTIEYLRKIIHIGGLLGASALVFGSPKNRLINNLPQSEVKEVATEFFTAVGKLAFDEGCVFCIEPNPTDYGCDFITTSTQAVELVRQVNHPGFGLHLDAAGMTMSNEDISKQLPRAMAGLCHFHISEPGLKPVGTGGVDHVLIANLFKASRYAHWHSIEMRHQENQGNLTAIAETLKFVQKTYRI